MVAIKLIEIRLHHPGESPDGWKTLVPGSSGGGAAIVTHSPIYGIDHPPVVESSKERAPGLAGSHRHSVRAPVNPDSPGTIPIAGWGWCGLN